MELNGLKDCRLEEVNTNCEARLRKVPDLLEKNTEKRAKYYE